MKNGVFLTVYITGIEDYGSASCKASSVFSFFLLGGAQLPESTHCTRPIEQQILLFDSVMVALIKQFFGEPFSARFNSLTEKKSRSLALIRILTRYRSLSLSLPGLAVIIITRKPCCCKETARCRSCSFPFNGEHEKILTSAVFA